MTREEAKRYIIQHCNPDYPKGKTEWERAVNMAIKALEQLEQRWIPVTKEEVFKAGYEGREIRFRVDGRLFAIRELAQ